MDAPRCRRFDLGDLLIAAATLVVTLALMPAEWFDEVGMRWVTGRPRFEPALGGDPGPRFPTLDLLAQTAESLAWLWCGATVGYLVFRLRRPRPPLAGLRQQPGFVAGAVVLVAASFHLGLAAIGWHPSRRPMAFEVWFGLGYGASLVVIGAWLGLRLAGQWRPEPGWIDRLGRFLGWAWIASYLLSKVAWAVNMARWTAG